MPKNGQLPGSSQTTVLASILEEILIQLYVGIYCAMFCPIEGGFLLCIH